MADTVVHEPHRHRPHPKPRDYWIIGFTLAVITAIEVALSYTDFLGIGGPILLVIAAILKFAIVAMWFMHLRFDLGVYSRFFLLGIIGAIVLFTVVLATFAAL